MLVDDMIIKLVSDWWIDQVIAHCTDHFENLINHSLFIHSYGFFFVFFLSLKHCLHDTSCDIHMCVVQYSFHKIVCLFLVFLSCLHYKLQQLLYSSSIIIGRTTKLNHSSLRIRVLNICIQYSPQPIRRMTLSWHLQSIIS